MKKISLIVPVYNLEKYLNECYKSISQQTYTNWELIFIDDGSTDRSLAICKEIAKKDSRVHVIHSTNYGVSHARNIGIEASNGEYIMFIDGDEQEGENKIEIVVTAEAGNQKTYYIYVTKIDNAKMANANLKTLEVENFSIYPDFKRNIYNYNLTINKDIKKLNITAKPENEKSKIEIMGNENLKEGDNFIKVIVTAEDGKTIKTYKINAYISLKNVQIKQEDKTPAIIILGILSVCIIVVAIFIVKQNKK